MKKLTLMALALPVLGVSFLACTDAGDPYIPDVPTQANVDIRVTDGVGAWDADGLYIRGTLTGDQNVALVQDGIFWDVRVAGVVAGDYAYSVYTDDGSKAEQEVLSGLAVSVSADLEVSGDEDIELVPGDGTGFRLVVTNLNTETYDNIKIKGTFDGWAVTSRDGQTADGMYVYRNIASDLAADDYEWGVIHDDGTEFGIWLLPGSNLPFTVPASGAVTGTTTFTVEPSTPPVDVTIMVDMSAEIVSGDGVHVAGGFAPDYPEWQPAGIDMVDQGEGIWAVTLTLSSDTEYEFTFVNGTGWPDQESVPETCGVDNNNGGFNRTLTTGTTPVTYSAAFSGCPAGN